MNNVSFLFIATAHIKCHNIGWEAARLAKIRMYIEMLTTDHALRHSKERTHGYCWSILDSCGLMRVDVKSVICLLLCLTKECSERLAGHMAAAG